MEQNQKESSRHLLASSADSVLTLCHAHISGWCRGVQHPAFTEAEGMAEETRGKCLVAKAAQQGPLEQDSGCHREVWQVTGLAKLEFKPSTACKCRGKSQTHVMHTRFCLTCRCVWSPPFESTAIFPHSRRGSPSSVAAVHLGTFYFLSPYSKCCDPALTLILPPSAPLSLPPPLPVAHWIILIPVFHPAPITFLKHPWMLLCLLTTQPPPLLFHVLLWEELKMDKPKLFRVATLKSGGSVKAKLIQAAWTHTHTPKHSPVKQKTTTLERYVTYCYFINNVAYNCFK